MSIKKNIYFICYGTTINDIIKSINKELKIKNKKKKINLFDYLFGNLNKNTSINSKIIDTNIQKDIEKNIHTNIQANIEKNINKKKIEEFEENMIYGIGIKELLLLKDNKENDKILKNVDKIYSTIDIPSIESSIILCNKKTIYPLPYTTKDMHINNSSDYYRLKNKFGEYIIKEKKTYLKKYWETKMDILNLNKGLNIKNINTTIDWSYCSKNNNYNSKIFKYNINLFEDVLKDICKRDINKDIIIVSNPDLIINLLKKVKSIKYKENKDIVENSSLWKFEITIDNIDIKYDIFNKIYPTEYNYLPLKYDQKNKVYEYTYNKNKYILFNSLNPIPKKYLYYLSYSILSKKNQDKIKYQIKNDKKNNMDTENKKFNFDNFA